jgi:hypothetical protein
MITNVVFSVPIASCIEYYDSTKSKCPKSYLLINRSSSRTKIVNGLSLYQNNNHSHIEKIKFQIIDQSGFKTNLFAGHPTAELESPVYEG